MPPGLRVVIALLVAVPPMTGAVATAPTAVAAPSGLRCAGDGLVTLLALEPRPLLELRYASPYNFLGATLYPQPVTARKDDARAADQAASTNVVGMMLFSGGG